MKKITICGCFLLGVLVLYCILSVVYVSPLISQVDMVFQGNVPVSETQNTPLALYNYSDRMLPGYQVNSSVKCVFAFHNFQRGYVWVRYEYWVFDEDGQLQFGFANRFPVSPSRWTVEKVDGEWRILDIVEEP